MSCVYQLLGHDKHSRMFSRKKCTIIKKTIRDVHIASQNFTEQYGLDVCVSCKFRCWSSSPNTIWSRGFRRSLGLDEVMVVRFTNGISAFVRRGWCGSVEWVPACEPKGLRFDSQPGFTAGVRARSLVGDCSVGSKWWMFLLHIDVSSHSFSLLSPLSTNKWIIN